MLRFTKKFNLQINCLKLRKEVPELNLKCEDMLFNISKNKHDFDKISLIELNSIKKEPRFFDSQKNSRDEETAAAQAEIGRAHV